MPEVTSSLVGFIELPPRDAAWSTEGDDDRTLEAALRRLAALPAEPAAGFVPVNRLRGNGHNVRTIVIHADSARLRSDLWQAAAQRRRRLG